MAYVFTFFGYWLSYLNSRGKKAEAVALCSLVSGGPARGLMAKSRNLIHQSLSLDLHNQSQSICQYIYIYIYRYV